MATLVPGPPAFTQLLDRGLPSGVARAEWSPTMDLLALLTADGQLQLHRLNWQRLWSLTPEAPITALAWRPDGRQLAVGLRSGALLLLDTEDGETQEQSRVFTTPIVALAWTASNLKAEPGRPLIPPGDRARALFEPPLPPAPAHASLSSTPFENFAERLGKRADARWGPKPETLSVIAAASAEGFGELVMCAGDGLVLLARLPIWIEDSADATVTALALPPTLTEVAVRWRDAAGAERLTLLSTAAAMAHPVAQAALHQAASLAADLTRGACAVRAAAWDLWRQWDAVRSEVDSFKATLNALLAQHGMESDARSDLLLLVTMGEYTPAMEQFLMSSLGEQGMKKVARAIDAALCGAHAQLVDRLAPEVEALAFRLGELRGLASSPLNRALLGHVVQIVGGVERRALSLLSTLERVREALVTVASQYRTFFSWLTTALRRFPEDTVDTMMGYPLSHVDNVRAFLHTEFAASVVEPLISVDPDPQDCAPDAGLPENDDSDDPTDALDGPWLHTAAVAWVDNVTEQDAWVDGLIRDVARQFRIEDKADQERWREEDEAVATADAVRSSGAGVLQQVCEIQGALLKMLSRPGITLSAMLQLANASPVTAVLAEPSASGGGGGGGVSLSSGIQGALTYSDVGELTIVLPVEVAQGRPGLAKLTLSPAAAPSPDACRLFPLKVPAAEREAEVSAVVLEPDQTLIDLGLYKDGAVAALLALESDAASCACLAVLPPELLAGQSTTWTALVSAPPVTQLREGAWAGGPPPALALDDCRSRVLPGDEPVAPLAVSASRGIGFALAGPRRAVLYDLVEDDAADSDGIADIDE